ncbi:unnamed protein product [Peronospora destructor]|uniref:Uncharacterized protein n=1 Tax=Peronospora destructor TaxID=86335 RepID=A0AAV0TJ12_9STRA|nr:unnamed protein product [Peronospora destructor]
MASGGEAHAYLDSLEAADHQQLFYYPDGKVLFPGDDLSLWILSDSISPDGIQECFQVKRFSVEDQGVRLTGAAKQHFRLRKRLPAEANAELLWGEVEILVQDRIQLILFDELCWQRRAKLEGQSREKNANTSLQRVHGRQFPAYYEHALYNVQVLVQKIQNTLLSNIHGEWFYKPHTERSNGRGDEDECDEKASLVHYLSVPSDEQDPKLSHFG